MGKGLLWISIVVLVIGIILLVVRQVLDKPSSTVKNGLLIAGIVFILAAITMMIIYFVKRSKAKKMMGGYSSQGYPPQMPQGYGQYAPPNPYAQALQAQQAMYGLQNAQAAIAGGQMGQMY
jgi:drug/metabolite transporter (DMT)-like permease